MKIEPIRGEFASANSPPGWGKRHPRGRSRADLPLCELDHALTVIGRLMEVHYRILGSGQLRPLTADLVAWLLADIEATYPEAVFLAGTQGLRNDWRRTRGVSKRKLAARAEAYRIRFEALRNQRA